MADPDYPWYTVVHGRDPGLQQGDFLPDCPLLLLPDQVSYQSLMQGAEYDTPVDLFDVVIMSQSCDLAHGKLSTVMLCKHYGLAALGQQDPEYAKAKARNHIREGHVPGYHMLAACQLPGFEREPQVVDFRGVYGLPLPFLREFAASLGTRLRRLPPYREHLAQAFARYFMRVGLPVDIPRFH